MREGERDGDAGLRDFPQCFQLGSAAARASSGESQLRTRREAGNRHASAALAQSVEHIIRNDGVRCSSHLSGTIHLQVHEPPFQGAPDALDICFFKRVAAMA